MHVFFSSSSDSVKLNENESVKISVSLKHILNVCFNIKLTMRYLDVSISALKLHIRFDSDDDVISLTRYCMSMFDFEFTVFSNILQYFLITVLKFFITFCKVDLSMNQFKKKNTDF